jgi:hypothetical protein
MFCLLIEIWKISETLLNEKGSNLLNQKLSFEEKTQAKTTKTGPSHHVLQLRLQL